jgi:hypothetical protein
MGASFYIPCQLRTADSNVARTLKRRFAVTEITDLSAAESEGKFLEGTGSIVLDRRSRIAAHGRRSVSAILQNHRVQAGDVRREGR